MNVVFQRYFFGVCGGSGGGGSIDPIFPSVSSQDAGGGGTVHRTRACARCVCVCVQKKLQIFQVLNNYNQLSKRNE